MVASVLAASRVLLLDVRYIGQSDDAPSTRTDHSENCGGDVRSLPLFRAVQAACVWTVSHVGQVDQIDHDLDDLDTNLPLRDAVQDLCSTDPTQETCVRSWRSYGSHPAA